MGNSNSTTLTAPTNSTGFSFQLFTNLFTLPPAVAVVAPDRSERLRPNSCPQVDRTTSIVIPAKGTHTVTTFTKMNPPDAPQSANLSKARRVEAAGKPVVTPMVMEIPKIQAQTEEKTDPERLGVQESLTDTDSPHMHGHVNVFDYDELVEEYYAEHPNLTPVPVNTITQIERVCNEQYGTCRFIPTTTTIYRAQ